MTNTPDECNHLCLCPIEGVIDVISKKWALFIINVLCNRGKLRFNDLMHELNGISPKTLSDTLKNLQAERIIKENPSLKSLHGLNIRFHRTASNWEKP